MTNSVSRRYFFMGSLLSGAVPAAGWGSVASLRALGYKPFYSSVILIAAGGLLALLPPVFGIPLAAYLSVALLLIGGITALPRKGLLEYRQIV